MFKYRTDLLQGSGSCRTSAGQSQGGREGGRLEGGGGGGASVTYIPARQSQHSSQEVADVGECRVHEENIRVATRATHSQRV